MDLGMCIVVAAVIVGSAIAYGADKIAAAIQEKKK